MWPQAKGGEREKDLSRTRLGSTCLVLQHGDFSVALVWNRAVWVPFALKNEVLDLAWMRLSWWRALNSGRQTDCAKLGQSQRMLVMNQAAAEIARSNATRWDFEIWSSRKKLRFWASNFRFWRKFHIICELARQRLRAIETNWISIKPIESQSKLYWPCKQLNFKPAESQINWI